MSNTIIVLSSKYSIIPSLIKSPEDYGDIDIPIHINRINLTVRQGRDAQGALSPALRCCVVGGRADCGCWTLYITLYVLNKPARKRTRRTNTRGALVSLGLYAQCFSAQHAHLAKTHNTAKTMMMLGKDRICKTLFSLSAAATQQHLIKFRC